MEPSITKLSASKDVHQPHKIKAIRADVYSRVVGYYTPVSNWNKGKQEEFSQREMIAIPKD